MLQDSDEIEEVFGARRERGLVAKPPERGHKGEQVDPVDINSRSSVGLSMGK